MSRINSSIKFLVACILSILIAVSMGTYALAQETNGTEVFDGSGTVAEPYLLHTPEDLVQFSDLVNNSEMSFEGEYFALENDIDMSGIEFTPIGVYKGEHYFLGTLDGNGYSIKNLSIDIPKGNNGLFGMLGGTVCNLTVDGGEINGFCCGVISSHAANSSAMIFNCLTKNVTVNGLRTGGIVDNFSGSVINCVSYNCVLNGTDKYGEISSYSIGTKSFQNFYKPCENIDGIASPSIEECNPIDSDLQSVATSLNSTYKLNDDFSVANWKNCNVWTLKDNALSLSPVKLPASLIDNRNSLTGNGTLENPYLISNAAELVIFRDAVNCGYDFNGEYVFQTEDIDLSEETWIPIGQVSSDNYFNGTYNGQGHKILNLNTISSGDNGLFGMLGGTVVNLGIESGKIKGSNCGSIASQAASDSALIANCYSKATVNATRAGGIADDFSGSIIGCWSDCELNGDVTGGIASYNAKEILYCKTTAEVLVPENSFTGNCSDSQTEISSFSYEIDSAKKDFYNKADKIESLSGLDVDLYAFSTVNGELQFDDEPYTKFSFTAWLGNHIGLIIAIVLFIALYVCLLLKVGPKKIYNDDRKWWKRFVLLLAPIFLFSYMAFIHSPIEFYLVNIAEFEFLFVDFAYLFIAFGIIFALCFSAILAFIKGIACDVIACLFCGFDLAMYIQLNIMNSSLGFLDGTKTEIPTSQYVINTIVWVVLIVLPFVLLFVLKKFRGKILIFLSVLLCVMQITSLVTFILQSPENAFKHEVSEYCLSANDQFLVSSKENIIVIIVDTYSNAYTEECFATYPEVTDTIKDFTYYTNANCLYEGTVYSVNYLASGTYWDTSMKIDDWCETAWDTEKNNEFYSRLNKQGYVFNLYSNELMSLSDKAKSDAVGKVANIVEIENEYIPNKKAISELLLDSTLYRFAPLLLKDTFDFSAFDFTETCEVLNPSYDDIELEIGGYNKNSTFLKFLREKGVTTDDENKYYIFQHLRGVHPPYSTNEYCEDKKDATMLENEKGCWYAIGEYLDQLKAVGAYDNSTIIILGDHGEHHNYYNAQPIFFIKTPNETHDAFVENTAPISYEDVMPTVMYLAGGEYSDFGTTIFEHDENELRERVVYVRKHDDELPDVPKRDSSTTSKLNCFYQYIYTGDIEDLREVGAEGPTAKIPWTDAFY